MQAVLVSRVFCDHSVRYKHTHKYKKVEVLQDLFQLFLPASVLISKTICYRVHVKFKASEP